MSLSSPLPILSHSNKVSGSTSTISTNAFSPSTGSLMQRWKFKICKHLINLCRTQIPSSKVKSYDLSIAFTPSFSWNKQQTVFTGKIWYNSLFLDHNSQCFWVGVLASLLRMSWAKFYQVVFMYPSNPLVSNNFLFLERKGAVKKNQRLWLK